MTETTERERLIEELENYEQCANAAYSSNLLVKGKLLLDILDFLKASKPHELTRKEWQIWKNNPKRDPICKVWKDDYTPCWIFKPEEVNEPAYLIGDLKLFSGKPDSSIIHWKK